MILDQSKLIEEIKYFCEEMKSIESLEGWICSLGHGINKLTPETKPIWEKMNATQMIWHCK